MYILLWKRLTFGAWEYFAAVARSTEIGAWWVCDMTPRNKLPVELNRTPVTSPWCTAVGDCKVRSMRPLYLDVELFAISQRNIIRLSANSV